MTFLLSSFSLVLAVSAVGLLADSSRPYPLPDSERREPFRQSFSRGQLLVGDSTANGCDHKTIEPLQGVKLHVAVIESESELVHITAKMLFARVMIHASNTAFQQSPNAFYRVRMSQSTAILALRVVDGLVGKEQAANAAVSPVFVRAERRANGNIIVNGLLNGRQIGRSDRHRFSSTATLTHSENRLFTDRTATEHQPLISVFRGLLAADIRLVNFDNALQFVDVRAARFAEPLKHKPRRFLRNAYLFAQLERRDAFSGGNEQIHRVNPFVKRNVRPLKDRASPHGEVQRASVATIEAVFADGDTFAGLASGTNNAVRPESGFEILPSRLLVGNEFKQLKGRYCAFAHRPNLAKLC